MTCFFQIAYFNAFDMKDSGAFFVSWKAVTIKSNESLERMQMPRILVPPEVLIRVSEEATRAAEELETTKNP